MLARGCCHNLLSPLLRRRSHPSLRAATRHCCSSCLRYSLHATVGKHAPHDFFLFLMVRQKLRFVPLAHLHGDEHFALLWEGHPVFFFFMGMYMSSSSFR